jgi:hypothetical protein
MNSGKSAADTPHRPNTNFAAFAVGIPLGIVLLFLFHKGPLHHTFLYRYIERPVEGVELIMFCCAISALGAKYVQSLVERRAFHIEILPPWNGRPVPVSDANTLRSGLERVSRGLRKTFLFQRIQAILDFLCQRGSAAELDDQMRSLLDSDGIVLEGSYALTRFITWAIPILGFLGTVLGITDAISGATPEVLEKNMSQVTDGLSYAFDATALALSLTMITMFCSYLVERREQGILEEVDREVERQLAHRFLRIAGDSGPFVEALRQNTQILLDATGQLVERQAEVWAKTLTEYDRRVAEASNRQRDELSGALESAMHGTLQAHGQMLSTLEKQSVEQSARLFEQLAALATVVREYGRDQQSALARVGEGLAAQAAALGGLQQGEQHLLQLQAGLQRNLEALANAGAFEQTLHTLTAAIHLLTARVGGTVVSSSGREATNRTVSPQATPPPRANLGKAA